MIVTASFRVRDPAKSSTRLINYTMIVTASFGVRDPAKSSTCLINYTMIIIHCKYVNYAIETKYSRFFPVKKLKNIDHFPCLVV